MGDFRSSRAQPIVMALVSVLTRRLPYRVRQFGLAFAPVATAEVTAAIQAAALPPAAARLFRAMPRPYQRHALNVAARLQRAGHRDPVLLAAALLHDSGKWDAVSGRRVGLLQRIGVTLLARLGPGRRVLTLLAAGPPRRHSSRYGWYLQQAHPALGAAAAAAAGLPPPVVMLIRTHADAAACPPALQPTLRLLQWADDQE